MTLISCKDCQAEFSSDAKRCLQCGAKRPFNGWDGLSAFYKLLFAWVILKYLIVPVVNNFTACPRLRESVRQHDKLAAILSDSLLDTALQARYGTLSTDRCLSLLASINSPQPASVKNLLRPSLPVQTDLLTEQRSFLYHPPHVISLNGEAKIMERPTLNSEGLRALEEIPAKANFFNGNISIPSK